MNKLENVAFWVMAPTMMLTVNHPSKMVRVAGVLGVLFLCPLTIIGLPLFAVTVIIEIYKEI